MLPRAMSPHAAVAATILLPNYLGRSVTRRGAPGCIVHFVQTVQYVRGKSGTGAYVG